MKEVSPVILITGASAGIGAASARLFGRSGYRVALTARRLELLEQMASEIREAGGEALAIKADLTVSDEVQQVVEGVLDRFKQIDILFNNAGIGKLNWLERLDPQKDIQSLLEANLLAPILMAQAVLPHMIERQRGHIINMASLSGLIATPTYSLYSASKFGVRGFSEALRREVGIFGIKVSVLYPGGVTTGFAAADVVRRKTGIKTPRWLALTPDDVAAAVLSLARRPRRSLVIPQAMRFAVWMNALFPGILDWGIEQFFVKRERS